MIHMYICEYDVHNVIYKGQGINTDCYLPIKSCSETVFFAALAAPKLLYYSLYQTLRFLVLDQTNNYLDQNNFS